MKHLGLFEGIGGFSLAARWAGWETVAWCEIDKDCQKVLKKNFPDAEAFGDITKTDFTKYANTIDILTGGFPCQPFSKAGNKSGKEHDSYLWHEMFRAIREIKPKFIVGENVANILNMGIEEMLFELEGEGYKTEVFNIPSISVGASHKRERVWIVAYHNELRLSDVQQRGVFEVFEKWENKCLQVEELFGMEGEQEWIYQPRICGVIDGIPTELDKSRLKQIGNAIQPQIAYEIFKCINLLHFCKK
jgi:DNA (cytosine-5)-methyltransferase 1